MAELRVILLVPLFAYDTTIKRLNV